MTDRTAEKSQASDKPSLSERAKSTTDRAKSTLKRAADEHSANAAPGSGRSRRPSRGPRRARLRLTRLPDGHQKTKTQEPQHSASFPDTSVFFDKTPCASTPTPLNPRLTTPKARRGAGVVERGGLENR